MLNINEIFTSIQGEGHFTGTPAHFIRFQGCPVGCSFCDSKQTWKKEDAKYVWDTGELLNAIQTMTKIHSKVKHIVFTGGEPCWENPDLAHVMQVLPEMLGEGFTIQLETSGIYDAPWLPEIVQKLRCAPCKIPGVSIGAAALWVTVSPKIRQVKDKHYAPLAPHITTHCNELKFVVGGHNAIDVRIPAFLAKYPHLADWTKIYIQPIAFAGNKERTDMVTELCVEAAIQNGWNVSAQVHKMLNIK